MSVHSGFPARQVVIVGAGAQGLVVADILRTAATGARLVPAGFVDDDRSKTGNVILGLPVLGTLEQLAAVPHDAVIVAIGDNALRQQLALELQAQGERLVTVRHPFSSIGHGVEIGDGSIISAGVVIAASVRIGRGVLVNTGACIDHETVVEDFAHVGPRAVLGGLAFIGARALVGLGASVMSSRRVEADAIVGAGAVVTRDVRSGTVATGVPARAQTART